MTNRHSIKLSLQIIESPSPDEIFDARTEGSLLRESLGIAGIPVFYNIAVNADKLVDALTMFVERRAQEPDSLPILHLSMHGHPNGVSLTDNEFLTWDQLRDLLLYVAQGKLLVCMSSCHGYSGCRMAMSEKAAIPFLALIGHDDEVILGDAAIAYAAFYHRLFKGATIPEAVEAMKKASGDDRFMYIAGPDARRIWKQEITRAQAQEARTHLQVYLQTLLRTGSAEFGAPSNQALDRTADATGERE